MPDKPTAAATSLADVLRRGRELAYAGINLISPRTPEETYLRRADPLAARRHKVWLRDNKSAIRQLEAPPLHEDIADPQERHEKLLQAFNRQTRIMAQNTAGPTHRRMQSIVNALLTSQLHETRKASDAQEQQALAALRKAKQPPVYVAPMDGFDN